MSTAQPVVRTRLRARGIDPTRRRRWWRRVLPGSSKGVRVLLVRGDAYLGLLLRLQLPGCEVLECDDEEQAIALLDTSPSLIVTAVRPGSRFLTTLLARQSRPPVVGLVDTDGAQVMPPPGFDQILFRPFVPGELHQSVRRALGLPDPRPPRPLLPLVRRVVAGARLGAVAIAAILMVNARLPSWRAVVLAAAFAYATLRLPVPRWPRAAVIADAIVVSALLLSTGGQTSQFILFAIAATLGAGLDIGTKGGSSAGGVVSLATFPLVANALVNHQSHGSDAVVFLMLFPLAGVAGGYMRYVLGGPDPEGSAHFAEANKMLSALYRITRSMPGGLETSAVARAAVGELVDSLGAEAGLVFLEDGGTLSPAAAFGITHADEMTVRPGEGPLGAAAERSTVTTIDTDTMSPPHASVLQSHSRWWAAPVRRGGAVLGLIIAAGGSEAEGSARANLSRIAAEFAVAIENARLFARVRGLSIDEERRRIARDIHDGVAQSLTHIRFELDHLRRHVVKDSPEVSAELERLSRVVGRAGEDVRKTIVGLRSGMSIGKRLAPAISDYLEDLRGLSGPELEFDSQADPTLREDVASEIFRIAQEAVSNAIRHGGASRVRIGLSADSGQIILEVQDDGKGIDNERDPGSGVGLKGMAERASAIGARLEVLSPPSGGATVRLVVPMEVDK